MLLTLILFSTLPQQPRSAPLISPIFGDGMVIQRGKPNTFWGWAKPGETIRVQIAGKSATGTADLNGRWQARLDPPAAGGPYTVSIDGPAHVELHDVLVGDVWLCGGQSNMQLGLFAVTNGQAEVAAADRPKIRFFQVQQKAAYSPTALVSGSWQVCSPQTAGFHSAVAYYFAVTLQERLHVPIGLVEDCVGGTPAETWTTPESLHKFKDFDVPLAEMEKERLKGAPEYGNYVMHWYDEFDPGEKSGWMNPDFDDSDWASVKVPGAFAQMGFGGTPADCWFRKVVDLPNPLPAGDARILLGSVERMDTTYVNGHWTGASAWVENPRVYRIPAANLHPGRNVIAVRDFKVSSKEGFISGADSLKLILGDGTSIPLGGDWKGKVAVDARPPHPMPLTFENWPVMPSVLFSGMIAPVAPLAIRGTIWYQGEANSDRAFQYRTLLPAMIRDWRRVFRQGDLPFYIVSLPYFTTHRDQPGTDGWAEMREAQAYVASHVKNSGLAVTIDTGDANNIHPREKKVVGERLGYVALANEYRDAAVPCLGPTYKSFEITGNMVRVNFSNADDGLVMKGDAIKAFEIAGADRVWHWAKADINGNSVYVVSPDVPAPVAIRYAWQANPPPANLYNRVGLPMVPFRTDDWPGVTERHKLS